MRDRDVRNAIVAALQATNAYDAVVLWGLPENFGSGSSNASFAAVDPASSHQSDRWDSQTLGGLIITTLVTITLAYRAEDAQVRDEAAELLFETAANALNGQSLAGLTLPAMTHFMSWRWETPTPPERRISSVFSYSYIVEGWDSYDTTP